MRLTRARQKVLSLAYLNIRDMNEHTFIFQHTQCLRQCIVQSDLGVFSLDCSYSHPSVAYQSSSSVEISVNRGVSSNLETDGNQLVPGQENMVDDAFSSNLHSSKAACPACDQSQAYFSLFGFRCGQYSLLTVVQLQTNHHKNREINSYDFAFNALGQFSCIC